MSTVGFGDFTPQSDFERVGIISILIFGVALFSKMMSMFISIIDQVKLVYEDLDDGDELEKFFGLLKRFNGGRRLNQKV